MMDFTHGLGAVLSAYSLVQAPMVAGLMKGRADFVRYLKSPFVAAPLTALIGAGGAIAGIWLQHGLLQTALSAGVSLVLGYNTGRAYADYDPSNQLHQRGSMVADAPPPRARRAQAAPEAGITLAGTLVPSQDEAKHFKLIGTTGTGKSTAIQEMMSRALARGDRAVIADPDGGYMRRFYDPKRGDVVLNPFDERSVKWDLFAEIQNSYDIEQLARSLIPDHGQDRSWRGYARTFFTAVTRQAHEGGIKDVGELYRLLVVADSSELRTLVQGTPAQPFLDEHNSRMFDSIRSVTSAAVGALEHISQQRAASFSVRNWVNDGGGVLFMPYKAGQIAALHSAISGWMRIAIFETMDQDESPPAPADERPRPNDRERRLWFVVDELDALGQIDGLKDALARLRKFGGRCVLGFQSIAQVSSTYGAGDAHTIVENCGNTLILRCSASEGGGTARFASQLIGEREVLRTTTARSRRVTDVFGSISRSEHVSVESAVLPAQVEQLPDLSGYLKYASDPVWMRVRLEATQAWQQRGGERHAAADRKPDRHAGYQHE